MSTTVNSHAPIDSLPTIAIIGSGIGGLALAIGLLAKDIPCVIYESAAEFSTVGAGVGLGPNALKAINGIDSRFGAMYNKVKTGNKSPQRINDMFEALLCEEGFGIKQGWRGGSVGAPFFQRSSAHRKALLDIMSSFIPSEIIKFNKRAVKITEGAERVTITFADGEVAVFDTVIGGDGIKGVTRHAVLAEQYPQHVASEYSGFYVYRAILPMAEATRILGEVAEDAKWFMSNGRSLAMYPISNGRELNFVCFIKDTQSWTHEQSVLDITKEEMMADLYGFDHRLLELFDYAKPQRWPLFHHKDTPTYFKGRICLIGDAAHATTPFQAAGAGQALEDAMILSRLLCLVKRSQQLERVYEIYDSIRRPRANRVVQTSYEAGLLYSLCHPEVGLDMEKLVVNGNNRVLWIWTHDLDADIELGESMFKTLGDNTSGPDEAKETVQRGVIWKVAEDIVAWVLARLYLPK